MFGFVIATLPTLSEEEKERYRSVYCGLCHSLKDNYGQISRAALSYDLAFYILLGNSLNEPPETQRSIHCPAHPTRLTPLAQSSVTERAADLTIALAYHKCLDDIADDHNMTARAGEHLLAKAYQKARTRIPTICEAIEQSMAAIRLIEADPNSSPDAAAAEFGTLMGAIFSADAGYWTETMEQFGYHLGRFIYLMDAAVDKEKDAKNGSYNPFANLDLTAQDMKTLLAIIIGEATHSFEQLPLEQDLHLMRNILYGGVWQQFNKTYKDELNLSANDLDTLSNASLENNLAEAQISVLDSDRTAEYR